MTARLVQERLNAAGFGSLTVDGQIGPATIAALDRALAVGPVKATDPGLDQNDAILAVVVFRLASGGLKRIEAKAGPASMTVSTGD